MSKRITVSENIGIQRCGEFVRVGVPFAKGELLCAGDLSLQAPALEAQPVQVAALNHWKDGSVKWALVDFCATVPALGQGEYFLVTGKGGTQKAGPGVEIIPGEATWKVDTGAAVFFIDARQFRPFASVARAGGEILAAKGRFTLVTAEELRPALSVDAIELESEGPLKSILVIRGSLAGRLRVTGKIHFFAGSSLVRLEITIHNPRAARHPGGLWDLGDPGSLLLRELSLEFDLPAGAATQIECSPEPGVDPIRCGAEGFSLYQESSGGENWLSPAHRTREGKVPFTLQGYQIKLGGKQAGAGGRATPVTWCGAAGSGLAVVLPRFWQEFPKAVEAKGGTLKIAFFPGCFPALHELQGGEQKTHSVYLDFAAGPGGLEWARAPLRAVPAPEVVQLAGVLSDLPSMAGGNQGAQGLVEQFISGPEEFLRKREAVDEYGWRNFGEIYADHEAVYHQGAEPFASHYNNQYDPCAGMYRRFLATGDQLWGELASDLARHVLDIDIYRTAGDREEYNNGMFWHTDHYAAAGLATHRSFSREQVGKRDPRNCGGGPGAQHCYTTGLMLHYFLTGDFEARDAVVSLADWCYRSICGAQTLLSAAINARYYLSMLRRADKDNPKAFARFPLTRGTGNTICACLDAYEVTGNRKYLSRAEELIRGALHPEDNPNARDLLNAELCWSYTVLLVSVAKFLEKLGEMSEFGEGYCYARDCLLAYAQWMDLHEYPYLEKPEILEYPNETWPAQDLRKSVIFFHAAKYAEVDRREEFLRRGSFFFSAAKDHFSRHRTCGFTRPIALMLQNDWVESRFADAGRDENGVESTGGYRGRRIPMLNYPAVLARITGDLARALCNFSPRREIAWLKARI